MTHSIRADKLVKTEKKEIENVLNEKQMKKK